MIAIVGLVRSGGSHHRLSSARRHNDVNSLDVKCWKQTRYERAIVQAASKSVMGNPVGSPRSNRSPFAQHHCVLTRDAIKCEYQAREQINCPTSDSILSRNHTSSLFRPLHHSQHSACCNSQAIQSDPPLAQHCEDSRSSLE